MTQGPSLGATVFARNFIIALTILFSFLAPPAFAQDCGDPQPFHRLFEQDIPGGYYRMGEDAEISARFRANSSGITADFRIIKPYRTKDFGSGVAFWVCDANEQNAIRVVLKDTEGQQTVRLVVFRFLNLPEPNRKSDTVLERQLSIPKNSTGQIALQKDTEGHLIVRVDGRTFTVDPGFDLDKVYTQVYCANGWIRFLDGDLLS
jgi:hypothetical protein